MTDNYESELDLDVVMQQIQQHADKMESAQKELTSIKEQLSSIKRLEAELIERKKQIDANLWRDKSEARRLEKQIEQAKQEEEVREEKARLVREFEEKSAYLDNLTATATWREFAYDHQITGGKRLAVARKGILADKRGLGKTLTGLIWLDMVEARKSLVIAPNDVVEQFEGEIQAWAAHRNIMSFSGLKPEARALVYPMLKQLDGFIITLNYEAWRRDKSIIDSLISIGLDSIVLDEAHKIKESSKVTARGVFQLVHQKNYCPSCKTVGHFEPWYDMKDALTNYSRQEKGKYGFLDANPHAQPRCETCNCVLESTVKNCLSMTGTPFLNKPQELFSLLYLVNPVAFPNKDAFLHSYCYQYDTNRWAFKPGGFARLAKHLSEFFLQRTREDAGIVVPPPAIITHELEFDKAKYPEQHRAHRELTNAAVMILEQGEGEAFNMTSILQIITRQRQVMTWPEGIIFRDPETGEELCNFDVRESQKVDAVEDLIRDLVDEEERVVVFSQFKAPLYELQRRLGHMATTATGDDSKFHRSEVRDDFDLKFAPERPRWSVLLSTFKAFGVGVNLNAARHVIILDDEWNPGMEDQAIGRIDRLNSVDQATVHIFRVKDTIDTFMAALLNEKRKITMDFQDNIVSAADLLSAFREGKA